MGLAASESRDFNDFCARRTWASGGFCPTPRRHGRQAVFGLISFFDRGVESAICHFERVLRLFPPRCPPETANRTLAAKPEKELPCGQSDER
jgi:hypothetical protein